MKKISPFFIALMLFGTMTHAGVSVNPVQLYILDTGKQKSTTLTLESVDEVEKRIFEVKAFVWTQDDAGKSVLTADDTIIINPKNFILQPQKQQTIRIGFGRPIASVLTNNQEKAWRIIVDEIPQAAKENSVNFLVNFSLPLFVGKQEPLDMKFKLENGHLKVINNANSHVQITALKIVDVNKKEVFKNETMSYLLAKKSMLYDLNNIKLNASQNYYIQLSSDKNDKVVEFKLSD
ncbi:molecular chaperone [Acinetobacter sp. ANC 4648]|uniref:fimbrial biogenesis chaperone n=1 Tax=Acinetobacter sp. ANC 4648 TaxID=1977875 RepID=UPI000A34D5FD|nr:fimbria/pilus periplasmic chaperone [Acinetobacter sp. ANC 4648]OTG84761.1 protein CsuC [Acinetobacter sp. ANC 4648]